MLVTIHFVKTSTSKRYYFHPPTSKLNHVCFFSCFAIDRDVIIISGIDTFSSLLAGCVIFSVLGSMAVAKGVPIDKVASKDGN